jgi:hypothetical protein
MTPQAVTSPTREPTAFTPRRRAIVAVPALAGIAYIAYTASWVAGLSVAPSSTSVRPTGSAVLASYAGHLGGATAQFVLTEGTASVLLGVVVVALGRAGLRAGAARSAWLTLGAGLTAAAIGIVQSGIGLYLTGSVVPAGRAGDAAALTDIISRLDGVKMLLLAATAIATAAMARRTGLLPRWLQWTALALAVAIIASGIGYALLISSLALAAWVSLPLLLVWVTSAGILLARPGRAGRRPGR